MNAGTANSGPVAAPPVLDLHEVSRTYPGAVPVEALKSVTFAIEPGELVAIQGPSGSGKSTLLGLLGCLDVPTAGKLAVSGRDAGRMRDGERSRLRREVMGFVFQQFHLIPYLTARQNVETALLYRGLSKSERRARAVDALERVGLAARGHHRPSFLSGGEQQRVAIARAIVASPQVVLADEPTGNLDSQNASMVLDILESVARNGTAVVLVTHDMDIAGRAGRRISMFDGAITSDVRQAAAV